MRDALPNGRKCILTYNAYRAHLSFKVLNLFLENGIIAYALPTHSSSAIHPCDRAVSGKLKSELKGVVESLVAPGSEDALDMFQFCPAMREAYYKSFTHTHITASFARSGLWP